MATEPGQAATATGCAVNITISLIDHTLSGIGANWTTATLGRHGAARLDGLGILFSAQGSLLFVGNDGEMSALIVGFGVCAAATTQTTSVAMT